MVTRKKGLGIVLILVMAVSSAAFAIESPQVSVQALLGTIQKIKTGDTIDPEQKITNAQLSAGALIFLDMDTVGRKTLGKYWKQRSAQEQKRFVALLSRLFEKTAFPNSARFFADLDIRYKDNEVEGNRALVPILVTHEEEGELEIDFLMHRTKEKWQVVDVILDGVSMLNNLRSQFYKVIAGSDYSALKRRLNKQLKGDK